MMNIKRINPPKTLHDFIAICKKTGYLKADVSEKHLQNIKFMPLANLLREKIVREWTCIEKRFKSNIKIYSDKDIPEMKPNTPFLDKHKEISRLYEADGSTPFGFSEIHQVKKEIVHGNAANEKEITVQVDGSGRALMGFYMVPEDQDLEYFYNIQRQRKLWWMKYASNPGRFSISEVRDEKIRGYKMQVVSLLANYSFGTLQLENIQLFPAKCFQTKMDSTLTSKVVKTSASLEIATLGKILVLNRFAQ